MRTLTFALLSSVCACICQPSIAQAQDACPNRGQLDTLYCDADRDLVADVPTDPARRHDPSMLIWTYAPVEGPIVYVNVFKPFAEYLAQCTGKRIAYYPVPSNSIEIDAMRAGRLHFGAFSTGSLGFAVNFAGAVPFAVVGTATEIQGYNMIAIVKSSSPYEKLADLRGKKVAHSYPTSNSGNLAPRALLPAEGLTVDQDYMPIMAGAHDKAILGVGTGDYDMAAVGSDVFDRLVTRGTIKAADYRILYRSPIFPVSPFAYAHDLKPELASKLKGCFYSFRFTAEMQKEFSGADRFLPITYQKDWAVVRDVAERSGTPYTRSGYETEAKRDADALAKKQPETAAPAPKP